MISRFAFTLMSGLFLLRTVLGLLRSILFVVRAALGLIWVLLVALVALLSKLLIPSVEGRLRKLREVDQLGVLTEGKLCPQCQGVNQPGAQICFACGNALATGSKFSQVPANSYMVIGIAAGLIIVVFLLIIL